MNKFLAVAFAAVVAAILVNAAAEITITECKDSECKTGCKVVGKVAQGQCEQDHFRHDSSFDAVCGPAPNALCLYQGIFKLNETNPTGSCVDGQALHIENVQCDSCFFNMHDKKFQMVSGCNTTTLTVNYDCDAACKTCVHTAKIADKTCVPMTANKMAIGYGTPQKCTGEILSSHYNASADCTGDKFTMKNFVDSCYGEMGHGRFYHCS